MFKNGCRLVIVVLLAVAGCSIPFFDRAEIVPGPKITGGISLNTGYAAPGVSEMPLPLPLLLIITPYEDYYLDIAGTARLGYGFSEKVELVLQGTLANGIWLTRSHEGPYLSPLIYDIQFGAKFRASRKSALQTTLGFPGLLDIWYLYDFNRFLTGTAGIGLRGIALGLTGTLPLKRNLLLHIGANLTSGEMWGRPMHLPAASLGIGLGYKPGR